MQGTAAFWHYESFEPTSARIGRLVADVDEDEEADRRHKGFVVTPLWGYMPFASLREDEGVTHGPIAPPSYFGQLEANVGLFLGFRVGVNFVEIADFVAGLAGFDPLEDDVELFDAARWKLEQEAARQRENLGSLRQE